MIVDLLKIEVKGGFSGIIRILSIVPYLMLSLPCLMVSYVWYESEYYDRNYLQQLVTAQSQFKEAEQALFEEFFPIPGVIIDGRSFNLNALGVDLTVGYHATSITQEEALNYFKQRLEKRGFVLKDVDRNLYIRGTACVTAHTGSGNTIWVTFWYDYTNQSYGPHVSPDWMITYKTMGENWKSSHLYQSHSLSDRRLDSLMTIYQTGSDIYYIGRHLQCAIIYRAI